MCKYVVLGIKYMKHDTDSKILNIRITNSFLIKIFNKISLHFQSQVESFNLKNK